MISNTQCYVDYKGDGTTTAFPFTYPYRSKEDIVGYLVDEYGIGTKITSNYEFDTIENKYKYPVTGTPLASTQTFRVIRETPIKQSTDLPDKMPYSDIESALDMLTMIIQEQEAAVEQLPTVRQMAKSTSEAATAAATSAAASATSAGESATSATNSANSATASANSATAAATSATAAANSAMEANNTVANERQNAEAVAASAAAAATSATNAANSASAANTSVS